MNQIFLGEPSQKIKSWFIENFPSWPAYTTLEFVDGTTQTKEIIGAATWQNIGVKNGEWQSNNTLKSCQLGNTVTEISSIAFQGCSSLTSINIPDSVSSIGSHAFQGCSLTSIIFPNSVIEIGIHTFYGCTSLISVNIPNSVTSIGDTAFYGCVSLTSVVFEGRAMSDITSITGYPWSAKTSVIKPGIN